MYHLSMNIYRKQKHKIQEYVSEYIRIHQNTVFSQDTTEYIRNIRILYRPPPPPNFIDRRHSHPKLPNAEPPKPEPNETQLASKASGSSGSVIHGVEVSPPHKCGRQERPSEYLRWS